MGKTKFGNANAQRNNNAKGKNQFNQEFGKELSFQSQKMKQNAEAMKYTYGQEFASYAEFEAAKMNNAEQRPNMPKQKNHQ
ncbi:hypothetical protein ACFOU2_11590 [Bacillus songklensis]|uniref:Small, acid-soluble spore protein gamma-type n=1 Tax=Bacillus songklensis TaxID=1069116 RepID=A0ABV8B1C4_9BACI